MEILSKRFIYEVGFYGLLSTPATGPTGEASGLQPGTSAPQYRYRSVPPHFPGFVPRKDLCASPNSPNMSLVLNPPESCFKSLRKAFKYTTFASIVVQVQAIRGQSRQKVGCAYEAHTPRAVMVADRPAARVKGGQTAH